MKQTVAISGLAVMLALHPWAAYAVGGAESMDRPSAHLPELPDYAPNKAPEDFVLPTVPKKAAPGKNVIDRQRLLFIKHIAVEGNSVFSEADLRPLVQPYEARNVTVLELEELRQQLTQRYIDRGYVNSGAIIPTDAYENGELRMVIIEGRLDEVRIKGQERLREGYIKNRLLPNPELAFNLQDLQDRFQTLLSDPLITRMNGRILPGASPGHGILDVDVTRAKPYQLSLLGNNQRPPSIGAEAFGVNGVLRNLTGLGDALDFTFFTSAGSERYTGGFNLPISDWGTTAFFHFDEGDSMVLEQPINKIDIKSQVHSIEGGLSHPLINSSRQRLNLGALFTVRENETRLLGQPFSFIPGESTGRNQATVLRLFQDYLLRGERQALALRSTFSVGLNALGATPSTQSQYPSSEFYAWLGQAQYAHQFFDNGSQFVLRGNAQFSDKPLLPLERISVGGLYTVRGYRENYLVRDEGYSLSAEFHYPLYGGAGTNEPFRLSLVPFTDFGEAWNHGGTETTKTIASIGAGLDMQIKSLHAEFYYGYALYRRDLQKTGDLQDNGVHFQLRFDVL